MNKLTPNRRWIFDQDYRRFFATDLLAGTDEVGRGAMAGPIVVAAIILPPSYNQTLVRDSKLLTAKQRKMLYDELIEVAISYVIEVVPVELVEKLNPKQASIQAMTRAVELLQPTPVACLVDGEKLKDARFQWVQIIKGDDLSLTIGAASILAKVTRDEIMNELGKEFPGYQLGKNKGYCTLEHQRLVAELGVSACHRKTYAPIRKLLKKISD